MKKALLFISFCALTHIYSIAQNVSWANNVACLIYTHCTGCHNPNGLAPFSLTTYSDVFNKRFSIQAEVEAKTMPPYTPDINYRSYAHQKTLTTDEINLIKTWVLQGAPEGNPAIAPPIPTYSSSLEIPSPTASYKMPVYTLPSLTQDLYRSFVISNPYSMDTYVTAIEVVPGNKNIVHHCLIFSDTSRIPLMLDMADSLPGYTSFGGIGSTTAKLITGWVPGTEAFKLPSNMGIKIPSGSRIIIQIHYPQYSSGQTDSTKVNFVLTTTPTSRLVAINPILNHSVNLVNGPLFIPANTVKTFHEQVTIGNDFTLLSISPHAHLLCKKMTSYAVTPSFDTIRLLDIPDWDFHWQGTFHFQKPLKIPAGSTLHGYATYDNTTANPDNPSSPPKNVGLGEATTDEMMLFYFTYLPYLNGDENIVVDTSSHMKHYLNCDINFRTGIDENIMNYPSFTIYPNPVYESLHLTETIQKRIVSYSIYDMAGKMILEGAIKNDIELSFIQSGIYVLQLTADDGMKLNKRFVKR